ncbi:MAG: hypothetical protein WAK93_15105 [Solirubrobacteraceae bacterium]
MPEYEPRPSTNTDHEHHYERAPDPAEASDRPLEPKSSSEELSSSDDPAGLGENIDDDPHHALNTPVGDVDPEADSDPYRTPTPDDDADHASGTTEAGQGVDDV